MHRNSSIFEKIAIYTRWKDWGPSKIPVYFTILAYISLTTRNISNEMMLDFINFIFYAAIHSALGYVINDWGDRTTDRIQGKSNVFQDMTDIQGIAYLGVLFVFSFTAGIRFIGKTAFLPLWAGWAFSMMSYSLRPMRLKERGIWGLGISSVAQWTLPVFLSFAAMDRFGGLEMIFFSIASTISGATLEIAHQRWDRLRDQKTESHTFGVQTEQDKLERIYTKGLLADKAAQGMIVIVIAVNTYGIFDMLLWKIWVLTPPVLFAILICASQIESDKYRDNGELLDPYYTSERTANKLLHETTVNFIIPTYLLLSLTYLQMSMGLILFIFLFYRIVMGRADYLCLFRIFQDRFTK